MKILVVGNGGREHAISWKLKKDDPSIDLYCARGNAGTASLGTNVPIDATDVEALVAWAEENRPDFVVVGPEAPLCAGLVDALAEKGFPAFGPRSAGAQIEGSKAFAKDVMHAANVPTARAEVVRTADEARDAVARFGIPVVLKADGLAAGKGVIVCTAPEEADEAIDRLLVKREFGDTPVLVEEFLDGEEASMLAFVDGAHFVPMVSAQDHKRLCNADKGPNTGGMGAYSPAPAMTDEMAEIVANRVFAPVVAELASRGIDYKGVLYAGLMLTANGPKVLEFNCRFGDPETQCILPRLESPLLPILQACVAGTLSPDLVRWTPDPCVCVVLVAGGYPGHYAKGDKITGLAEAAKHQGVVVFHAGTLPRYGIALTDGGRVLGVTALGPDIAEATRRAYHAVMEIKFDGMFYRTDIAYRALRRLETP